MAIVRTLVLGGARSGKSARALALCEPVLERIYIATAEAGDEEMQARISAHKAERGGAWVTVEEPVDLCGALDRFAPSQSAGGVVLVDCLTVWLSNLMHAKRDVDSEVDKLCGCIQKYSGGLVLVSNEVGMGLVPDTPLGRAFRDAQGRANQRVAAVVDCVEFVVAGLPMCLKP